MRKFFVISAALTALFTASAAQAAVHLDAYADSKGYLNISTLTCDQLANTFQEDADSLALWLSGWYNGLGQKHYADLPRTVITEHKLIAYCQAHRSERILEALDHVFKSMRDSMPN